MVSIFTKVGVALIGFSVLFFFLINFLQIPFPFVFASYSNNTRVQIPTDGNHVDVSLAEINHPLNPFITYFQINYNLLCENGEVNGRILFLYSNPGKGIIGQFPRSEQTFRLTSNQEESYSSIPGVEGKFTTGKYEILLRISCNAYETNTGNLYLQSREIKVYFILYSVFLPILSFIGGISIAIGGFIFNFRRRRKGPIRAKKVPRGWEPSLQSSSSSSPGTKKAPKMAIKSSSTLKNTKQAVVEKTAPEAGAQEICKFCGKSISSSALICPHCYGKIS